MNLRASRIAPFRPALVLSLVLSTVLSLHAAGLKPVTLSLWPGTPPGETKPLGEEHDTSKPGEGLVAGKDLIRLANVSQPTLEVRRPAAHRDTGAAVLVCPGGGYNILAMDLEGTEICDWLNSLGVTGVVLKYRVPRRDGRPAHAAPLEDAQRALGLVRSHATEWGLDPQRIGVMGFSAGGHLAATLSNQNTNRTYAPVDAADALSCRPDFTLLIYPAYLTDPKNGDIVNAELPVSPATPPTFVIIAQDDPVRVENVLGYVGALQKSKVPMELHLFPTGGHGYGLRKTAEPITGWPDLASVWLERRGLLKRIGTK